MSQFTVLRRFLVLCSVLSMSLAVATASSDQVESNLQSRTDYWTNDEHDWVKVSPDQRKTGALKKAASGKVTFSLLKGKDYLFLGACDDQCSDLNLKLYDTSGKQIDIDTDDDEIPILEVTPDKDSVYTVNVSMADCSEAAGCGYGVDLYRAREDSDPPAVARAATAAAATDAAAGAATDAASTDSAAAADSSSEADQQAASYLQDRADIWKAQDDSWVRLPNLREIGTLEADDDTKVEFQLLKGKKYMFLAACSDDCSDIDLELLDDDGKLIDRDADADDTPLVTVTPDRDRTYKLKVSMSECSSSDDSDSDDSDSNTTECSYGVDIYRSK
jgi:hypothetical protein